MTWWTWFLFFTLGMNWLRYTTDAGFLAISAILGLEMFAFAWFARRWLARRNDAWGWLALGASFIGWEYLRTYLMGGYPWFLLGHTQHAYLPLIQAADLGGVPLVGLPAALLSALLGGGLARRLAGRPPGRDLAIACSGVAALLALLSGYGVWRLKTLKPTTVLNVGLVQANIPQSVKDAGRGGADSAWEMFRKHERLSREIQQSADLICWAETMFSWPINPRYPENERGLRTLARKVGRPMLIGVILVEPDGRTYNSALLLDAQGEIRGRYDKRHLVIVAEAMPFKTVAPWLPKLFEKITNLRWLGGLTHGERLDVMETRGRRFGTLICFDSMWPDEARSYAQQDAEFLCCISNDGWFHESEQLDQILATTKFRCIENRMGMARCTNTGISAFIGADGRVKEFAVKGAVKSVEGSTVAGVEGRASRTLFTAWGDWVGKGCLVLTAVLAFFSPRGRSGAGTPGAGPSPDPVAGREATS